MKKVNLVVLATVTIISHIISGATLQILSLVSKVAAVLGQKMQKTISLTS